MKKDEVDIRQVVWFDEFVLHNEKDADGGGKDKIKRAQVKYPVEGGEGYECDYVKEGGNVNRTPDA